MPAQLLALNEGPSILLDKPILLLGRDLECDIRLDSRKVSRRHCCVAQVNDHLVVRDLGSTNGIRINGIRVIEGNLKAGDELTIGNFRYRVRWEEPPGRPPAKPVKDHQATKPATPVSLPPSEDELLEACDEPMPLPEARSSRPAPVGRPLPPSEPMSPAESTEPPAPPPRYPPAPPDSPRLTPTGDVNGKSLPAHVPPFPSPLPRENDSSSFHLPPA